MNLFRNSITRKVQIIFLMLTVGVLLLSFVATISGANYLLRNTSIDYTHQLVTEVDNSVLAYQQNMENMGRAILGTPEVQEFIEGDKTQGDACVEIIDFALGTRDDITNIFVMASDQDGNLIIVSDEGDEAINTYADYKNTSWYKNIYEEGESSFLTASYVQNLISNQYNWVISLGMAVRDDLGQLKGLVLIDLNYSSIDRILNNVMPSEQGYIYLLSDNEEIVYHPNQQLIFNKVKSEDTAIIKNIQNNYKQVGDKVYVVLDSGISRWKTIAVLDSTVIYRNILINTIIFGSIGLIAVLLSFMVSYVFSNWFTKPIRNLARQMEKVQQGDLSVRVAVNSQDEIGHLSENFNLMTSRINSLVDRIVIEQEEKRNYELNALRSQINPHFLYNTLDSIIWMAECGSNEQVVEMTSALSKMLRASISHQRSGVTLGLEIQNAMNYLKIQKYRYANKLDYELDVDPSLYNKKAAHLILQPLVENAIYHGIKSRGGRGKITIRAFEVAGETKELVIQIADDGVGMSEVEIKHVLSKEGKNPYGIGVDNVNRRIALIYGDGYGLTIESEVGVGTTVSIRIPSIELHMEGDDIFEDHHS